MFDKNKECTYFITWICAVDGPIRIGNLTCESRATGRELTDALIIAVHEAVPGATILNIFKAN